MVGGVAETWQLVWKGAPRRAGCSEYSMAITCPCQGFSYSETGELDVVRLRHGREVDRYSVGPIFTESLGGGVMVQRWAMEKSDSDDTPLPTIQSRPTVQIMRFGDYDHDGGATEFYLQTEALPCGKSYGVAIGVSKRNPRLHAFGTASKPAEPLYLQKREWEALRDAKGPVEVLDWLCDDHGAEAETTVRLSWTAAGIVSKNKRYPCHAGRKGDWLVRSAP